MNLVLVEAHEVQGSRVRLEGRRATHIVEVHRAEAGRRLKVGVVDGPVGSGVVVSATPAAVELDVAFDGEPPPPIACTLVLAIPRPRVLHRVLGAAASFGIKRVVLFGACRVEKSYWQSPVAGDAEIRRALLLGLEQAGDTVVPVVQKRQRFRAFVEDELPALAAGSLALVADPGGAVECPRGADGPVTLVVGPEGGFVDFELELLAAAGFTSVTLGVRPLRTEYAVAALVGRLF